MIAFVSRWKRLVMASLTSLCCLGILACTPEAASGQTSTTRGRHPFERRYPAPSLDGGLAWLNTAGPVEISKLKGKIVLVDFWTYCCINCIHVLPDLAKLEEEFANELVVIGVHSAKFLGERDSENIRGAVLRYEIKHPVVNDGQMAIWQRWGVNSWPTLALVDAEGFIVRAYGGEGQYKEIREDIEKLVKYYKKSGQLNTVPIEFRLEQAQTEKTPLRFPGKLLADREGNRLFIADSSHHRIVIANLQTGALEDIVGTGTPGLIDGTYQVAQFNDPQGLALAGQTLYVADRKNHALRAVDLQKKTVKLISGDGNRTYPRSRRGLAYPTGPAEKQGLASPWDLCLVGDNLFIAMAGNHQIWRYKISTNIMGPYAGNTREDIVDGGPSSANFAQPSGLAFDGKYLYVADSEVSAIRKIDIGNDETTTVVGEGLFEFGDQDGKGKSNIRLQHALAVQVYKGQLIVADTYNNKLKWIDPVNIIAKSWLGTNRPGKSDSPPQFDEPAGLSIVGDTLYVADTNNHAIRVVDLATNSVKTLEITGLEPPAITDPQSAEAVAMTWEKSIQLPSTSLKPKAEYLFKGSVTVRPGFKLNPTAPMGYQVWARLGDQAKPIRLSQSRFEKISPKFSISLPEGLVTQDCQLLVAVTYYPCQDNDEGVCKIETTRWVLPVKLAKDGGRVIELTAP